MVLSVWASAALRQEYPPPPSQRHAKGRAALAGGESLSARSEAAVTAPLRSQGLRSGGTKDLSKDTAVGEVVTSWGF